MINSETRSIIAFNISSVDVISFSSLPTQTATEAKTSDEISTITGSDAVEQASHSTPSSSPLLDSDYMEVPVVGLPGPAFTAIHSSALFSISTSVLVSISLLVFLCTCRRRRRQKMGKQQQSEETGKSLTSFRGFSRSMTADSCLEESTKVESAVDNSDDNNSNEVAASNSTTTPGR